MKIILFSFALSRFFVLFVSSCLGRNREAKSIFGGPEESREKLLSNQTRPRRESRSEYIGTSRNDSNMRTKTDRIYNYGLGGISKRFFSPSCHMDVTWMSLGCQRLKLFFVSLSFSFQFVMMSVHLVCFVRSMCQLVLFCASNLRKTTKMNP